MKVFHREGVAGRFTSFKHLSVDGKPSASSFVGWLTVDECLAILKRYREKVRLS